MVVDNPPAATNPRLIWLWILVGFVGLLLGVIFFIFAALFLSPIFAQRIHWILPPPANRRVRGATNYIFFV
jgi:hypothetical protein